MAGLDADELQIYERTVNDAALFDLSRHGLLSCAGKDAAQFLHNLCTNDVTKLPARRSTEAFFTTAQGKIVDHVWIWNVGGSEPTFFVDAGENEGARILQHLDRFLISEQLELSDVTESLAHFHLAGPRSCELLTRAFGSELGSLQELESAPMTSCNRQARAWRRNRLGVVGYDLLWSAQESAEWLQTLGISAAAPAGGRAYDCMRIEAGLPLFGIDVTVANLPQEVGRIDQTINFSKGCYIGQETVARIRALGHVNRTLRGLVFAEKELVEPGTKLFHNGAEAGEVTSCTISPRMNCAIALAYVRREHDAPDTQLTLGSASGGRLALVSKLPFLPFVESNGGGNGVAEKPEHQLHASN